MYLLTEWEGRTGKYLARGLYLLTESQIFSHPAPPYSVNKYIEFLLPVTLLFTGPIPNIFTKPPPSSLQFQVTQFHAFINFSKNTQSSNFVSSGDGTGICYDAPRWSNHFFSSKTSCWCKRDCRSYLSRLQGNCETLTHNRRQ